MEAVKAQYGINSLHVRLGDIVKRILSAIITAVMLSAMVSVPTHAKPVVSTTTTGDSIVQSYDPPSHAKDNKKKKKKRHGPPAHSNAGGKGKGKDKDKDKNNNGNNNPGGNNPGIGGGNGGGKNNNPGKGPKNEPPPRTNPKGNPNRNPSPPAPRVRDRGPAPTIIGDRPQIRRIHPNLSRRLARIERLLAEHLKDKPKPVIKERPVDLTTTEIVGLGTLSIIILCLLLLFGMWAGYMVGYRDSDKTNAQFLLTLRDALRKERK